MEELAHRRVPPRGIDFSNERKQAAGSRQNFRGQESAIIFPNSVFRILDRSLLFVQRSLGESAQGQSSDLPKKCPCVAQNGYFSRRFYSRMGTINLQKGQLGYQAIGVLPRCFYAGLKCNRRRLQD